MEEIHDACWRISVCAYRHTARGVPGGLMEVDPVEDGKELHVPLRDMVPELRRRHPDWRFLRLVLPASCPSPQKAEPFPISWFSVRPRPLPAEKQPDQDVVIRPASSEDRVEWEKLFKEYRISQIPGGSPPFAEDEVAAEAVWQMCAHGSDRSGRLLLATAGSILGAAHLVLQPRRDGGLRGFLSDIFVAPTAAGKGVGRALFSSVLSECLAANMPELCWFCISANSSAMSFYENLGFKPTTATVWQYPEMYASA
ncbi:unnamed protein product [Effrenium voratum]|nr:unnamed protein product [Effrenium voratum]